VILILQDCLLLTVFSCFILVLPDNNLALKLFTLLLILTDMITNTEQMIQLKDEKHNNYNKSMVIKLQYLTKRHF